MPRPKIEGLVNFNLRLLQTQLDAVDRVADDERLRRGDPGITRTSIIREAIAAYVSGRDRAGK